MMDKRIKAPNSSNFSLKCLKSVSKCVTELKRVIQIMQSDNSRILKHQISTISACSNNLLAALTSCNLYRIHFSNEDYYLTQMQKMEKGVTQILDLITSLSCRKFLSQLGNNSICADLFSSLEDAFISFVGPLLHIFSSFNVQCLLFECNQTHLFILDQLSKKEIKKKLKEERGSNIQSYDHLDHQEEIQEEEEEDLEREEEVEELEKKSEIIDSEMIQKAWNELQCKYISQVSDDCISELAILIDYMSQGDSERYAQVFKIYYSQLFDESTSNKIYFLLRRITSFKMLNKFAIYIFYNIEVICLPLQEIEQIIEQSTKFQLSDLKVKLIRSGFIASSLTPLNTSLTLPPDTVTTLKDQSLPENNESSINFQSIDFQKYNQSCGATTTEFTDMIDENTSKVNNQNNTNFFAECASCHLKIGSILKMCPHSLAFSDLCCVGNQEQPNDQQVANCNFLKDKKEFKTFKIEQSSLKIPLKYKSSTFKKSSVTDESNQIDHYQQKESIEEEIDRIPLFNKKEIIFGRRALNSMLKADFLFEEHEQYISRQQFKIIYEMHLNEYNVQCLSQSSLTQLLVDQSGYQLSVGSIFIIQDQIAFQVVALQSFPSSPKHSENERRVSSIVMQKKESKKETNQVNSSQETQKKARQKLAFRKTHLLEDQNDLSKGSIDNFTQSSSSNDEYSSEEDQNKQDEDDDTKNLKSSIKSKRSLTKKKSETEIPLFSSRNSESFGPCNSQNRDRASVECSSFSSLNEIANLQTNNTQMDEDATSDFKKVAQIIEKRESQTSLLSLSQLPNSFLPSASNSSSPPSKIPSAAAQSRASLAILPLNEHENNPNKDEAYLHIRVLWSSIKAEKEDFIFQYGRDMDKSSIQINFGADPKSNQITLIDNECKIRQSAHCAITYQDDEWAIVANHDSLDHYTGLALKNSEEVESGLVSKKILLEKGFNILVQGYIFNFEI